MCGICGYVGKNKIPENVFIAMRDTMYHRGPDDSGIWQGSCAEGFVGFAHRRLSIFDLSDLGHQPMVSQDGKVVVDFNGEIYNFLELQKELSTYGFRFRSHCDTEVILAAYEHWKEQCFVHFNGMFAIAIWDIVQNRLILARDRMGVKPLYYSLTAEGTFLFGSDLKALMRHPSFHKRIRQDMLKSYLCNKYIAAPDTIFENTYKMEPGTYLILEHGKISVSAYWDVLEEKRQGMEALFESEESALQVMDEIVQDAVKIRMAADVPVGILLSSGVDSALIAAMAKRVTEQQVNTFTIGFFDAERNEAEKARGIARYLGTNHVDIFMGEHEITEMLKELPYYYDEPFSDSSQLPTMLVSKLASEHVTVALSGDGADELFCGYKMYDWVRFAQKTDWIGGLLYHLPGMSGFKNRVSPEMRAFINNRLPEMKTQFFIDVMAEEADKLVGGGTWSPKFSCEKNFTYKNWQERRMMLDIMTYLPDEIMMKMDRASMKYSLEVRSPLLDYRLVQTSFRIRQEYKHNGNDKKYILKKLAYRSVPKELMSSEKKGFGVPLGKWLRSVFHQEIARYTEEAFIRRQGIFDSSAVKTLVNKQSHSDKIMYSSMLWSFYVFQRWYERWIDETA